MEEREWEARILVAVIGICFVSTLFGSLLILNEIVPFSTGYTIFTFILSVIGVRVSLSILPRWGDDCETF